MRRRLVGLALAGWVLLAVEGGWLARWPLALLHLAYAALPFCTGRLRLGVAAAIVLVAWGLGRVPVAVELSTVAILLYLLEWAEEEVEPTAPLAVAVWVAVAEGLRQFWGVLVAAGYGLPAPHFPWGHLLFEPALAAAMVGLVPRGR